MSLTRKTATYAGSAMIIAIVVILAANIYVGAGTSLTSSTSQGSNSTTTQTSTPSSSEPPSQSSSQQSSSSTSSPSSNSLVLLQLTDPPTVPIGTTSLNLSYSAIGLLVSEPAKNGQVTTTTVSVTPTGGSATVDLLKLQNVSQTIASAALPAGSTIYTATFTVSGISIEINGTSNVVTLATGGSSFVVTLTSGTVLNGTNAVLIDLTPTVVDTPAGYQMIPTSVGIMKPQSEVCQGSQSPGWTCPVTDNDQKNLTRAQGQLTANLVALTVAGNKTTVTVLVVNSGNTSVRLDEIGLQGNLTVQSNGCATTTSSTTTTTKSTTTTTTTTSKNEGRDSGGRGQGDNFGNPGCWNPGQWGQNQLLFTPVNPASTSSSTSTSTTSSTSSSTTATSPSTSTSSTSCATGQMTLSNGGGSNKGQSPLVLNPGQCIILTFTGTIVFGGTQLTLVPSTAAGQIFYLNVAASNNAQASLSCTLPLSPTSCTSVSVKEGW